MWLVCAIAVAAVVQGSLLTWLAKSFARRVDFLDRPNNDHKAHAAPIPLLGGVAVYLTAVLCAVQYYLLSLSTRIISWEEDRVTFMLLISGGLFCALGLWDDKWGMRPWTKFCFQILATLPFVLWGRSIENLHILGYSFTLHWLSVPVTISCIVICTNAVNLLDGLDGVASAVGIVVSLTVAVLALMTGHFDVAVLALILAGALTGFLFHNWPPASIFLGDSGSLTIGFLLGALAIEGVLKKATGLTLVLPLVLLSIPGFDTLMAVLRRVLSGRGIGQGDRAHLHHCLRDRGLSGSQVLLAIASLCLAMGLAVICSVLLENELVAITVCVTLLLFLIVGKVFGYNETALLLKHLQVLSTLPSTTSQIVRSKNLLDRLRVYPSAQRLDAWRELYEYLEQQGGLTLELVSHDNQADRDLGRLSWANSTNIDLVEPIWQLCCSLQHPKGIRTTLVASGQKPLGESPQRVDHLLELMEAFCARWPLEPMGTQTSQHRGSGLYSHPHLSIVRPYALDESPSPAPLAVDHVPYEREAA